MRRSNEILALAAALCACLPMAGCGNDIIAVNGKLADPAPEVSALHAVLGSHALDIAYLENIPTNPNGDFSVSYSDGSTFHGNVNHATGNFDVTLDISYSYNTKIHDVGRLALFGGSVSGATYAETFFYADSSIRSWDDQFTLSGPTLHLHAYEHGRDVTVVSDTTMNSFRVDFVETWDKPSTFHEDVQTSSYTTGTGEALHQSWYRDDLATDVSPDRSANFTLYSDGSGSGQLTWFYDHGIYYAYDISLASDGSQDETVVFEDPGTQVSPDGSGTFHFNANLSGTGDYTERYDDGSRMHLLETFATTGSEVVDYTFDDAATAFTPDLDGHQDIHSDGSGSGDWNVHDATGISETCTYDFDTTGSVANLSCQSPQAAAVSSMVRAWRALRGAPAATLRERLPPPHGTEY